MNELTVLTVESVNIRFLAWKEDADPANWASVLLRKASLTQKRAKELLSGHPPTAEERAALIEGFDVEAEAFGAARLFGCSREEVFDENIRYLFSGLPQGEKKRMSEALDVTEETVSRWSTRRTSPSANNISRILRYLGLDPTLDLGDVPLFLSLSPIGQFAQRRWLQKRLNELSSTKLSKFFPALEKLFGNDENH